MTPSEKDRVTRRLRRIAGQVEGLLRMVDQDRYCVDVLLQIAAAQAALGGVGKVILGSHVQHCVTDAIRSGEEAERQAKIDELLEVFSRFGHLRSR